MATTNLISNLDEAFERRFLFKVEFHKPSDTVMANIWKTRLKTFNISQCRELAKEFSFTGGQINNIIRKIEMFEVVKEIKVDFFKIKTLCKEEYFTENLHKKVGFKLK